LHRRSRQGTARQGSGPDGGLSARSPPSAHIGIVQEPGALTLFTSSTHVVPEARSIPRHVAIIMDGNGRWAKQRLLPRVAGHRKGVEAVRTTGPSCIKPGAGFPTVFGFPSQTLA